jgi:ATP-dependent helicase/nuclease subunit B
MPTERHFLGWDAPLTTKVCDYLLPGPLSGPSDLGGDLIVVPTRQAGRRLRETLARFCSREGSSLLSARVVTPSFFLRSSAPGVAPPALVKAIWSEVLQKADLGRYPALFPYLPPHIDFGWAMRTGCLIQRLREALADGGYRAADVPGAGGHSLAEADRWDDLAAVEADYLERVDSLGYTDPCTARMAEANVPRLPEDVARIVLAAVPDPSLLALRALDRLAAAIPVSVLVFAPEELADCFDEWGRPLPAQWFARDISIPDGEKNVVLAASPAMQAKRVLHEIAVCCPEYGPADIAVGVPDRSVAPFLAAALADKGLPAFDPADTPLNEHRLYSLLDGFGRLVNNGAYADVSALLRHPDLLAHLQDEHRVPPGQLLTELDRFQNERFPLGLADFRGALKPFPGLETAITFLDQSRAVLVEQGLEAGLRAFLQTVYGACQLNGARPEDDEFRQASEIIDAALHEMSDDWPAHLSVAPRDAFDIFLNRVGEETYHRERKEAVVDLEGWLELPWNDAPLLLVTGMNEGIVPDSRPGDVFLPESLRGTLNLRDDAFRLARDMYIMSALIASRADGGRVCFIAGKTSRSGEPLRPSRLFFYCPGAEIPDRARRLFGRVPEERRHHPSTVSFKMQPALCEPDPPYATPPTSLAVTSFRDYLACPLRFYLRHVLGMQALDDEKMGVDALDFGSMVHDALESMARDPEMRQCADEARLATFLTGRIDHWMARRFGKSLPLPLQVALASGRQRLTAAARRQAELVRAGWEILHSETKHQQQIAGIAVSGKIDRIDRHRETGRIRIIDYKTSDTAADPSGTHLANAREDTPRFARVTVAGKKKRWTDLQLPLYRALVASRDDLTGPAELAYFNLPKAVSETGVVTWQDCSRDLADSARGCAEAIIANIRKRVYWPPSDKLAHDDYEDLFHAAAGDCFEPP